MPMTMGKRLQSRTPYPYIPFEILFYGILNRLPVKSLLRFSCINKLWYTTIRDPEFVKSHLIHAIEKSSSSLLGVFQFKHADSNHYIIVNKDGGLVNFCFQTARWTCRVGYCNGLFCFRSRSGFEICNPSRREFLYHPLPPRPPPRCLICYGFGFDPLKNEYKVIQIVNGNENFRRCMVYTLGSNSWKDITVSSNFSICLDCRYLRGSNGLGGVVNSDKAHYSNGSLHWYFRRAHAILSFDIHSEKFSLIPGPISGYLIFTKCCRCFFLEWKGCMCLAFHNLLGHYLQIYMFVPKKHHTLSSGLSCIGSNVSLPYKVSSTIGVLGGGSLFYWFSKGHISLYTPDSGEYANLTRYEKIEKLPLPPDVDYAMLGEHEFYPYMDNLHSLKILVPSYASHMENTKGKNLLQVKSVSSL